MPDIYEGVIHKVVNVPGKDSYAVCLSESFPRNESITFTINSQTWKGTHTPQVAETVMLEDVHEMRGGWRAEKASPKIPKL